MIILGWKWVLKIFPEWRAKKSYLGSGIHGPPGPNRSGIFKILLVLVRSSPSFLNFAGPGPGPTGFGPWIPA